MKCALYKEVLYLDKEIENIETLRDINNNKIKCTKSYYINNSEILLNYFIKNSYKQRYIIDLKRSPSIKEFPDNCFIDIGKGKCYYLKLSESKIYKFYCVDRMMSTKVREWDVDTFSKYCEQFNKMGVGLSISKYAGNKMKSYWSTLNTRVINDGISAILRNAYHGGYFLNPEPVKVHEGKFWDYDYNAAYLYALGDVSNISGLFQLRKSIDKVPIGSRWIAYVQISKGRCTSKYPFLTSAGYISDFSEQEYTGMLTNDEVNIILKYYKDVDIKYKFILFSEVTNNYKLSSFVHEIDELRQSEFKMIAKAIYTHGIGNLGSQYEEVTASNMVYQLVLGSLRSKLYETVNFISSHGYSVYYIDTDGFATNCPPDELIKLGFNISDKLGDFKIEREGYNFMTTEADCKQYLWLDENGNINHKLSGDPDIVVEIAVNLYKEQLNKINRKGVTYEERISKSINKLNSYIDNCFNWWYRFANQNPSYNDSSWLYYWDFISNI